MIVRKSIKALVLTSLMCVCSAGCAHQRQSSSVDLHWQLLPSPPRVGAATVVLDLADPATKKPLTGLTVNVEGDMTHPGMVPVMASATETKPGHYEAHLNFTMAGDWVVIATATLTDHAKFERQIDVPGVKAQ